MERRDEDCKQQGQFNQKDDKCIYISFTISFNVLFGGLFYYYSLNTSNDQCTLLKQTALYFTLYCSCSIILSILTLIGNKTFNVITTIEGLIRMLFLVSFLIAYFYSFQCYHLQSLTLIYLTLHALLFFITCMKSSINKTKQL
ncbi:unnamed protein product (macronuclear) [Paramecium tetraurelia]|uniref:Transmembrane protein n=1 Tax=Paramecium tetraurelia TaxID=5888 RepID=A0DC74_PARTE|nr:uncharacterized protein GSPATT00015519001 [Paramecium tetraurelia]CAK80641.1 unnamed protein product [Paramecium tetraurelia]|eukprot:XP_001448038.1 hypothetical protein (macronuclear) [Paramecium tetraurelia strain d4-2]